MDRFSEEMTGSSTREQDDWRDEDDEETGCTPAEMAALPAAECVRCGSERKTVQGDREIRQGAVCCTEVA